MDDDILNHLNPRRGHFLLESGHHGDLWLDLDLLFLRPESMRHFAKALAFRLKNYNIDAVCGPLNEGAFAALMTASELGVEFWYAERCPRSDKEGLFTVDYRLPAALRTRARGKRVAIVNDVINAGSAVRGTYTDLCECGAEVLVAATMLLLGSLFEAFADKHELSLECLSKEPNHVWTPEECPLCAAGVALENFDAR